jgi:hypothetical protein
MKYSNRTKYTSNGLFHLVIRKIPINNTTPHIKEKKATKYSKNSEIDEFRESLKTSKTADGVELIVEFNQ